MYLFAKIQFFSIDDIKTSNNHIYLQKFNLLSCKHKYDYFYLNRKRSRDEDKNYHL